MLLFMCNEIAELVKNVPVSLQFVPCDTPYYYTLHFTYNNTLLQYPCYAMTSPKYWELFQKQTQDTNVLHKTKDCSEIMVVYSNETKMKQMLQNMPQKNGRYIFY